MSDEKGAVLTGEELDEIARLEKEATKGARISAAKTRHGHSKRYQKSPEYNTWAGMRKRCENPRAKGFARYGGRGIRVCERWLLFDSFLADMGTRPSDRHSIGRLDNDGDYGPDNCRWETPEEQARNTRATKTITHDGECLTFAEWARRIGVAPATITRRVQAGESVAEILAPSRRAYMRKRVA